MIDVCLSYYRLMSYDNDYYMVNNITVMITMILKAITDTT